MRYLIFIIALSLASGSLAADYTVPLTTYVVNGQTYCNSSPCTSSDRIIIEGGEREGLTFEDFDGNGSYISIVNESADPDAQVKINQGWNNGLAMLNFVDCKYIDFDMSNDPDLEYGLLINAGSDNKEGVRISGQSRYFKIGYIDITFTGNTDYGTNGIFLQDSTETSAWTWEGWEIHNNRITGAPYAGMYLGQNTASSSDRAYIKNYSIHHNKIINPQQYGFGVKSANGGTGYIYSNYVSDTGTCTSCYNDTDAFKVGIKVLYIYGSAVTHVYGNTVFDTIGAGFFSLPDGSANGMIYLHDNIFAGNGTGGDSAYGHAVSALFGADITAYDNIIIQPTGYGLYANGVSELTHYGNLIGDAGSGATGSVGDAVLTAQTPVNTYNADVADFSFVTWSDDSDYTNDVFTISTCSDGVMGGDETGVDCGGSCSACVTSGGFTGGTGTVSFSGGTGTVVFQ